VKVRDERQDGMHCMLALLLIYVLSGKVRGSAEKHFVLKGKIMRMN
jgi:hypothetical protein